MKQLLFEIISVIFFVISLIACCGGSFLYMYAYFKTWDDVYATITAKWLAGTLPFVIISFLYLHRAFIKEPFKEK